MRQGVKSQSTPRVHTTGLLSSAPTSGDTMEKKRIARYCVGNGHLNGDNAWTARGREVILRQVNKQLHDGEITNSGTSMETSASSLGVGNTKDVEENMSGPDGGYNLARSKPEKKLS